MINQKYKSEIKQSLYQSMRDRGDLILDFSEVFVESVSAIAEIVEKSIKANNKLLFCGNGGSAAESQHMAAEYCATLDHSRPRKGMPAIALTTDSSFITAWTNDFGFEDIFKRQVETLGREGDVLMAYSTSGTSKNVLRAARAAKEIDMKVIIFTGNRQDLEIEAYSDCIFRAPSLSTPIIQEFHTMAGHEICAIVEKHLL